MIYVKWFIQQSYTEKIRESFNEVTRPPTAISKRMKTLNRRKGGNTL